MIIFLVDGQSSKFVEGTGEHVCVKKAILPKDGTIFDFILRPPNDESEIAKSSLLVVSELEVRRCNDTNNETVEAELKLEPIEKLLQKTTIKGFNLSYSSKTSPDIFPLK